MANLMNTWSECVFTFCSRRSACLPWEVREVAVYSMVFIFITRVLLLVMALRMPETAAAKTGEINLSALSHSHFIFRKRNLKQKFV